MVLKLFIAVLAIPILVASGMRNVRIVISGGDLSAPLEITDPATVERFQAGAGIGNFMGYGAGSLPSYRPQSFIVDWDLGATAAPPSQKIYTVTFKTTRPVHDSYIVRYAINSVTGHGYV